MSHLTDLPRIKRRYTLDEKASFFAAFERLGAVSAAAREVGFPVITCYQWCVKTGLITAGFQSRHREEYLRLRAEGLTRREATLKAGVNPRSTLDWEQGIIMSHGRRIYPDGRVIEYNRGVSTQRAFDGVSLLMLQRTLSPRFLSLVDREKIKDLHASGASVRATAAIMGRAPSTISRELRRNSSNNRSDDDRDGHTYQPYKAHRYAARRRLRPKERKLLTQEELKAFVQSKLRLHWSPEQICHALITEYPNNQEMRVSPETIYQTLYLQARGGLRREVQAALRTGRTRRKQHNTGFERRSRFVDPMVMISERPADVEDRAVPGHWEGDLIVGANNQSAIATLVERTTRYVMLVHLPGGHTAEEVRDGLVRTMSALPTQLRGSLTWDQGAEMAAHKQFSIATQMPVYFCDPASPWQRGSNENTNGLLRQYFPKSTDLSVYGVEDLEHVALELNARPRKTLGWRTPAERLRDLITST